MKLIALVKELANTLTEVAGWPSAAS